MTSTPETKPVGAAPAAGAAPADPRRWLVLTVASAAQFLAILDLFAVTVAFPALEKSFPQASLASMSWVLNGYTIVLAALLIPAGRLADETSRKGSFLIGMVLFGLSSVGCALAPGLTVLIIARVVQAVAAAVLVPTSLGLTLPAFPEHERSTAIGIWTAVAAVAAGSGPVLGGLLVELSWRWIFLINIPICAVAVLAGARLLPRVPRKASQGLDLLGSALILLASGALTMAFVEAPDWGYTSPGTLGCFLAAVVLVLACLRHIRRASDPIISPTLFASRLFRVGTIGIFLYYLAFASMLFEAALFLTGQWNYSVLRAGLGIAPTPVTVMILSALSGKIIRRTGARASAVSGGVVFAVGCAWWFAAAGPMPHYAAAYLPGAILVGAGNALIQPALFGAASGLPAEQLSVGSGTLMMSRQIGSALGVALLTAILGSSEHPTMGAFRHGWIYMIVTALLAALAGLRYRASVPAKA
ncbi:MFS transporter [Streptomyces roseoverticillatus]|uniref:MFS transporter n=1 Tax=Streptomyces roseoverticillatus TaxID=66429 RepID=UPI000693D144|nr:MFS transporter [Streptomyces roseoverticillatus]